MNKLRLYSIAILVLSIQLPIFLQAQQIPNTDRLVAEGKKLYRSEMASWYGTDMFLEKYKDQRSNIGGYFSYGDSSLTTCVFFSKGEDPIVLARVKFDSSFAIANAILDTTHTALTAFENDLRLIRKSALQEINKDTALFKMYDRTNYNLIPIIEGQEKKVYVLTGPLDNGLIIFGNDYLLQFTPDNQWRSSRRLHANILFTRFALPQKENEKVIGAMHSHVKETGDLITPTDIATLMLYESMAGLEQYYVLSEEYVSLWTCRTNSLTVLTRKAWERIYKDHGK